MKNKEIVDNAEYKEPTSREDILGSKEKDGD